MTPEDEEFNRIEMESRVKQEYVRAMNRKQIDDDFDREYEKWKELHECPKCSENKEARNLWRTLALDLWDRYKDKR